MAHHGTPDTGMKILGIRNAPQQLRYAVVTVVGEIWALENVATENLVRRPAGVNDVGAHLKWTRDELLRILRVNLGIDRIGLKTGEFRGNETAVIRTGSYLDAMVLLVGAEAGIPVTSRLYSQMATTRATVQEHAEARIARTADRWDAQMADAVAVAWIVGR
jgi:hypothetical protein